MPWMCPWELLGLGVFLILGQGLDRAILVLLILISNRGVLLPILVPYINSSIIAGIGGAIASLLLLVHLFPSSHGPVCPSSGILSKPMLFPCLTHHTRLFPKKHSFSYSYLLVGVPIGWIGSAGGLISVGEKGGSFSWLARFLGQRARRAWFDVDGEEYLSRGYSSAGLRGKLMIYLEDQGEDYHNYPYSYLLTAAKFLGYASNPISIWYLYSAQKVLTAVILEVNNTFGEKHSYFLKAKAEETSPNELSGDSSFQNSKQHKNKPPPFTDTWPKDFYVSVFNSRDGAYSLVLHDPLYPSMTGSGPINTTITLRGDDGQTKVVARLFSTDPGIDPTTISLLAKTKFLASWWWVGLATFPRTVVQAFVLLFRRGMPWVFRPEPRRHTLPRLADETERIIESLFREYLQHLVMRSSTAPIILSYTPAGLPHAKAQVMSSPAAQRNPSASKKIEMKVLTPLFYSRFIHYSLSLDALTRESRESATIWISEPSVLPDIFSGDDLHTYTKSRKDRYLFSLIGRLRAPPPAVTTRAVEKKSDGDVSITRPATVLSQETEMEAFMFGHSSLFERRRYGREVLKLLVSEYVALGWTGLLDFEIVLLRILAAWLIGRTLKL